MELNNSIRDYLRTLHQINGDFIVLASHDAIRNSDSTYLMIKTISDLVRLIPAKYDCKKQKYLLSTSDGLLEFKEELDFIKNDFDNLIKNYQDTISVLFKVRNKFQHKIHAIRQRGTTSGSDGLLSIDVEISGKTYYIRCDEIVPVIKELNVIYSKILKEILIIFDNNPKVYHAYYDKLRKYDFQEYNKVLQNDNIKIIGKIFQNFWD